ncbi:MAG TPA: pyridoxamine 5'-phosphate oxidase family protein [Frankiaceae bacterium]|nr:pyridoxamine 5'-phosphate oxidase family protein [Frankiaceae bacterium]
MASWAEVERAVPDLAREVRARFTAGKHSTMATLRSDGSPRISGTEVEFSDDGELRIGSMANALKARDLLRDGRVALHSPTSDPGGDGSSWAGEGKLAGTAVEEPSEDGSHRFRIDVAEVVLTRLGDVPDHLVVESWHGDDRGYVRRERR